MTEQQINDRRLAPKQISAEFHERMGVIVSEQFVRAMLKAGVRRIGYNARFVDVVEWWEKHPDFSPRGGARAARKARGIGMV